MHDFCICANSIGESKVLPMYLMHLSKRDKFPSGVHTGSFRQLKPLVEGFFCFFIRKNRKLQPIISVCNTLFAGAAVKLVVSSRRAVYGFYAVLAAKGDAKNE